jgi:hypothetical protein
MSLPPDIVQIMAAVGRFEFDPQGDDADAKVVSEIFPTLYPIAQSNPDEFIAALAGAVVPVGGWAVYGGAKTVFNLLGRKVDHPDYRSMLSTGLHFLRDRGASKGDLDSYEWEFWVQNEGGPESW